MLNADGKTWVESKWVNVKREVTIDNTVPEQVRGDKVRNTGGGIGIGQGKEHYLSCNRAVPIYTTSKEDLEEPSI